MNKNEIYKKAIENYKKIQNYTEIPLIPIYFALNKRLNERFMSQAQDFCKEKFGKDADPKQLSEKETEILQSVFRPKAIKFLTYKKKQVDLLFKYLYENASKIDMSAQKKFTVIDRSSTWGYNSQGYGADKYAKGELIIKASIIKQYGFDAKIEQYEEGKYRLMANCTKTQFFAMDLLEKSKEDYKQDLKQVCRDNGINAKVIYPLLEI